MTYTRREWAFLWAAGGAGTGTLTITGATMQAGSTFIVFVDGPEHGVQRADAGGGVTQTVKRTQHQDTAGKVQPSGADADVPVFVKLLSMMASIQGPGVYKSPYHFTAVQQAATALDFSGHPSITDETQILMVVQISSAGVVTVHNPELSTGAFSWDSVNDRLTVANATFAATDVFGVVIQAADRYANTPGDFLKIAEMLKKEDEGDDAMNPLITAALDFTANWADVGSEIPLNGVNRLVVWLNVDINDSTDLQFRLLCKHESGGTDEFVMPLETYSSTSVVDFEGVYHELAVDADILTYLVFKTEGATPYGQLQIKAGTLGVGTDAQLDDCGYTRGTFGG